MDLSSWSLAVAALKILIYVGVAAAVGGPFIAWINSPSERFLLVTRRYILGSLFIALIATIVSFFIQVGALSESGMIGMVDEIMMQILWQSNAGNSTLLRTSGLLIALWLAYLIGPRVLSHSRWKKGLLIFFYLLSLLLLACSFSVIGHSADMAIIFQVMLSTHVLIMAWWMGALWPLWYACRHLDSEVLHKLMHKFGQFAGAAVAILIVCGVLLTYQLVGSIEALVGTEYGQILMTKLLLVVAILLVAAWHKLKLVPALLTRDDGSSILARSIFIEMLLGVMILSATCVLTTLTGPAH